MGLFFSSPWLNMEQRVVLITGADSGIGLLFMQRMLEKQATVIALCYTSEGTQHAKQLGAHAIQCDLSQEEQIEQAAERIRAVANGNIFAVVHCAGIAAAGFIDFTLPIFFRRVMEINFFAVVSLTHKLLPLIKARDSNMRTSKREESGRVVVISSIAGIVALPANSTYNCSKFALDAYADTLRVEMDQFNVSVSVVTPSAMKTSMVTTFYDTVRATYNAIKQLSNYREWLQSYSEDWLDRYTKGGEEDIMGVSEDPKLVVDDLTHAVCNKNPRFRYLSGSAAKTLFYLLWIIPERWSYYFKKSLIKIKPY